MKREICNGFKRGFLLIPITLLLLHSTFGQEAPVKGVVKDKLGRRIPDVKITFADTGSGNKFTLKSNKEGKFLKFAIPPGEYKITAQPEGYYPYVTALVVIYGKEENLEIILEKIPPRLDEDKDFQDGVNFFKQGQYNEAMEYFEKAVARFPESAEAYYNLGVSKLRAGKTDQAIATLEKTVQLKPDLTEAYFALGECYFNKGESDRAIKVFSRTLDLNGQNAKSYYNLGIVYYRLNRVDEAISAFERSIELDPNFSSAYYQGGIAYVKKGDLKKALQYLEQFLRREPNAPEASQVKTMIEELKKQIGQ